jgi:glycerol-3-phosphate dehydrogenase
VRALADSAEFDVVVVGGGIIGSAAALDAAARGLRVALVEQNDFAAETSSRSTKLLHGGIRYLPHFEFGLVREGLLEQKVLVKTADYLYSPLEFVLPLYTDRGMADLPAWASNRRLLPLALRLGLTLYDMLGSRDTARHRRVGRDELIGLVPTLRSETLRGGFLYGDAQTDDARLTVALLKTAVFRHGAVAANGVRAESIEQHPSGFILHAHDLRGGDNFPIATRSIISATWAFRPPALVGGSEPADPKLSKGVHLLFDPEPLGIGERAIVLPETEDGRVLFIVPWRGMALLGTTDTPYSGPPGDAVADDSDIEYLLTHLHRYLEIDAIEPHAAFAGVRALLDDGGSTSKASRHHQIVDLAPRYVQVVGGKLTAHRPIAAGAVDRIAEQLGVDRPSSTATELLIGAGLGDRARETLAATAGATGLPDAYAGELARRYGTDATHVADLLAADPEMAERIGGGGFTLAEVVFAARHEAAATLADVALRRTHLAWTTRDHGRTSAPALARVLAVELGWSEAERDRQLADFEAVLVAEGL